MRSPVARSFRHIFAVSDIHTDYAENLAWARSLADGDYGEDVLIVAGDVSDRASTFEATMQALSAAFGAVFFVPGNHDLWVRRDGSEGADSLEKAARLEDVCEAAGVYRRRVRTCVGTLVVVLKITGPS